MSWRNAYKGGCAAAATATEQKEKAGKDGLREKR